MKNQIPDKTLMESVMQQLIRKGVNAVRIKVSVSGGTVTIDGIIKHDHERRSIISAAGAVTGVKHVLDQLRVK